MPGPDGSGRRLTLAAYRDIAIAISRRYFSNTKPFPHNVREDGTEVIANDEENEDAIDDEQWIRHVADLQAAHTTHVAEMAGFRTSSVHWHDLLGFNIKDVPSSVLADDRIAHDAVSRGAGGRHPIDPSRPFLGGRSDAHGRWEKHIVYVARRRCQAAGILCVEWDSHRHPDHAAIIFVTPESVFTDGFQSFLNRQRELMRLDRIIIDECHIMLNESETFRPRLQQLGRLHQCGVQIVFLTATLPPCEETQLFERMQVTREDISMHRERTSRHNVAYRVHRPVIASKHRSQTQ
ncbi:DEAD/DEAH box helicase [Penicillium cinerascens]|uniref:DEAD/DEAH box helicase n=1 Tax=Penicillium cinerascens TaxID=70096 RepID=A0A9W9MBE6_9EURO|nr:DEAD/DEAH box helicase [Penicillium cinerascens]KAJ5195639.1 DEAD/DEAH box helicase [Penicillium cinerascens]